MTEREKQRLLKEVQKFRKWWTGWQTLSLEIRTSNCRWNKIAIILTPAWPRMNKPHSKISTRNKKTGRDMLKLRTFLISKSARNNSKRTLKTERTNPSCINGHKQFRKMRVTVLKWRTKENLSSFLIRNSSKSKWTKMLLLLTLPVLKSEPMRFWSRRNTNLVVRWIQKKLEWIGSCSKRLQELNVERVHLLNSSDKQMHHSEKQVYLKTVLLFRECKLCVL